MMILRTNQDILQRFHNLYRQQNCRSIIKWLKGVRSLVKGKHLPKIGGLLQFLILLIHIMTDNLEPIQNSRNMEKKI